jgi:hypothetical protein
LSRGALRPRARSSLTLLPDGAGAGAGAVASAGGAGAGDGAGSLRGAGAGGADSRGMLRPCARSSPAPDLAPPRSAPAKASDGIARGSDLCTATARGWAGAAAREPLRPSAWAPGAVARDATSIPVMTRADFMTSLLMG